MHFQGHSPQIERRTTSHARVVALGSREDRGSKQPNDRASASFVLHVLDHSWPVLSGYAIRSRNLISAQRGLGESIQAVTSPLHQLDDPTASDVTLDGVEYLRTPIRGRLANAALRGRWPLAREREVVRMLRERLLEIVTSLPVSIVYAHSPALCGLAALQAARKRGLPFIYEIRAFWEDAAHADGATTASWRSGLTRRLETYVARRADAVAAIAKPMLTDLQSRGISGRKLFHVPNGVDTEQFMPADRDEALAQKLGLVDGPVFGFVGSLYRYEGVSWMIRAAAHLRSRGHRFNILIIGRGEDQPAIENAIRDCNAAHYVRTIDYVPHEQIARYYSVVDIAVYPRRSLRLTELVTPLKPLEAMALSKPVLASAVGGIRELVEDERTGLLFAPENISDFCRQAERMILSPALRQSLGERGRDFVVRERDWRILAGRYRQIYDFVLSDPQSRHA
jgi:PEP-CTERM/exosortase A-associated glycosyltransferase